ncbi:MAG: PIG-L deacetylase family protein [Pseudonocardiaceae bacterium]
MRRLRPERCDELLLLGAHCDDIAIGAGGTLLELCRANPGLRVVAAALSGGSSRREEEERAALEAFCPQAKLEITVLDIPDGRFPAHWERAKHTVQELRRHCDPDLVLAPPPHDAHQDHRTLSQLVPTAFRDHLILGYEIPKWDGDLAQPNAFLPLPAAVIDQKIELLHKHYPSQHDQGWFDEETFRGLARVRGVQCHSRYAEAFHASKLCLRVDAPGLVRR